jgi:hypothetical protein
VSTHCSRAGALNNARAFYFSFACCPCYSRKPGSAVSCFRANRFCEFPAPIVESQPKAEDEINQSSSQSFKRNVSYVTGVVSE